MAFRPDKEPPQFADLKGMLVQSKQTDPALYQTIQILLDRLEFIQGTTADIVNKINNSVNTIFSTVNITPNINATYLTTAPESVALPNSVQLLAGTGIAFDDSIANKRTVSATGAALPGPHAPTHSGGGSDPVDITHLGGYSGQINTVLRGNATWGAPPATALPLHAPTHSLGGADPVNVVNLAGYPGGATQFLRADATFAVPPGGSAGGMNLDYLGNYVSGPVYNDGDIVVWTDGVAYMCTVDGTTTPPEPWPGLGVAVNATVDATYWVVSPHASLTNERAMNGLGTGYVRSTVGEPSVVPTIPLTDTTGILPDNRLTSNVALKNIKNQFTMAQRISNASGDLARLTFTDITQPVDGRTWEVNLVSGGFNIWALNDAEGSILASVNISRSGVISGNGSGLSSLNASNLSSGLAAPPRLGSGTADATTFLRGDSTWQPVPSSIPSGMIVLSSIPCPPGWTRVGGGGVDGAFLMINTTWGATGGASTHAHSLGNMQIPAHSHPTATADPVGDHAHNFGIHAYFDSGNDTAGLLNVDGGSSGNMSRGPHNHRTQIDFDGGTSNSGNHAHTVPIPAAGAIGLAGGMDAASHIPPYFTTILCYKN